MASAINVLDTLVGSIQVIYNRLSKKQANGTEFTYDLHEDGEFGWNEGRVKGDILLTVSFYQLNSIYILFTTLEKNVKSEFIGLKKNLYVNNVSNGQFKNFKQSINDLSNLVGRYTINKDGFMIEAEGGEIKGDILDILPVIKELLRVL